MGPHYPTILSCTQVTRWVHAWDCGVAGLWVRQRLQLLHHLLLLLHAMIAAWPTGQLFPDTDPKWKGARSDIFLKEAVSSRPR